MELDILDFLQIAKFLGGFLYGMTSDPVLIIASLKSSLPGVYSGVFALYLHYAAKKAQKGTNNAILFYALCVLYILSGVVMILDLLFVEYAIFVPSLVSNNEYFI